jgi:hypothetical protein
VVEALRLRAGAQGDACESGEPCQSHPSDESRHFASSHVAPPVPAGTKSGAADGHPH